MQQHRGCNIHNKIKTNDPSRFGTVLLAAAVIASAMTMLFILHAETDDSSAEIVEGGWCGPDAYYTYYSDGTLEISGSGAMYSEPECMPWEAYREDITKIVIGDDILLLAQGAFSECVNLKELIIPITVNCVVSDQHSAFAGCCSIEKVTLTVGTDGYGYDYASAEGRNSFYQLTPWYQSRGVLKEFSFADGVKRIGDYAFPELNITSLTVPNSVVNLGVHSFFNCSKLTELTLPISANAVVSDRDPAFGGVCGLVKVTLSPGSGWGYDYAAYEVSDCCYQHTPWYQSRDVLKSVNFVCGITHIGSDAFRELKIVDIHIPDGVKTLGNHTFYNCSCMRAIYIPIGLDCLKFGKYPAFEGCPIEYTRIG